ncbi:sulfotransferase [Synechococcus sp. UW140]|uniref:sulfotransferase n=1 Tax=Synechococcus sp. UW140 TaxID=368503 RepID=UPI000E0E4BBD|nr:sulfotransferase [Synechococcus sp. UW140]
MNPIKLVYITGRGHSGSTLLALLISGHSQVISAGEVKMLNNPDPRHRLCSCHRLAPEQCPFWSQVEEQVQAQLGLPLRGLALMDQGDLATFARHNSVLFAAIAAVSGCAVIVDSSKSLPRLSRLLAAVDAEAISAVQVWPIHLHRGPLGLMNSVRKLGYSLRDSSDNYGRLFFRTRDCLASVPSLEVLYERLARHPRREVVRVMAWLGLPFEQQQLRWRLGVRRDVHGNAMRFGGSERIEPDDSWRWQLTLAQQCAVAVWTLPVRLRSPCLFRWMRWLMKPSGFAKASRTSDNLVP